MSYYHLQMFLYHEIETKKSSTPCLKGDKVRYINLNGRSSPKCKLVSHECELISPDAQNATISTLGKTRGGVGDAAAFGDTNGV
jgi:hypothetical protein